MEAVGGGVAHSISDHANHVAMRKQREQARSGDGKEARERLLAEMVARQARTVSS